jgi:uncharacterized protein (TIGR02453 family)
LFLHLSLLDLSPKSIKSFLIIVFCCGKNKEMLRKTTIDFLKNLKKNNNKEWFDANRTEYLMAKEDFEGLVSIIISQLTKIDARYGELKPKDCVFRINRDVRFSKDKSPTISTNLKRLLSTKHLKQLTEV